MPDGSEYQSGNFSVAAFFIKKLDKMHNMLYIYNQK